MTSCKVCGKQVRKTTVVMILRKGGLKGARVCGECVTQLGVTIVVAREVPHCKCGQPATKCHICAGSKPSLQMYDAIKALKGRVAAAKLMPGDGPDGSPEACHQDGRIEGLESAIELLEGGEVLMDPEEALKRARAAAERVHASSDDAAIELAEAFEALDKWLTEGGFQAKTLRTVKSKLADLKVAYAHGPGPNGEYMQGRIATYEEVISLLEGRDEALPPDTEELAKWLVAWCAEHGEVESAFLYPNPAHYVFTFSLFDDLAKKLGVEKEVLGEWFNAAQARRAIARQTGEGR